MIRTIVDVEHRTRWGGASSARLRVTGDGPTARSIGALGLDRRTPMGVFRTNAMRAILPAGKDFGAATARAA